MDRTIRILGKDSDFAVIRDGKPVHCAFDEDRLCKGTCAAFETAVGGFRTCMCNRGNFEIGCLQD